MFAGVKRSPNQFSVCHGRSCDHHRVYYRLIEDGVVVFRGRNMVFLANTLQSLVIRVTNGFQRAQ